MRSRLILVVVLLAVWALWGSVAVAFDHCAMMGPVCEAPCGLGVPSLPGTLPALPWPMPTIGTELLAQHAPTVSPHALDPVPRSGRLSS